MSIDKREEKALNAQIEVYLSTPFYIDMVDAVRCQLFNDLPSFYIQQLKDL